MGHSYTNLLFHVVCGTKRRVPHIAPDVRARLDPYIGGILRAEQCSLLAAGGMPDHSHWLIRFHPSKSMSDVMRIVKSQSSGWVHDQFPSLRSFAWQNGYGSFSVSQSGVESVMSYLARRDEHHREMTFTDEFESLLRKNNIDFDPKYLWADADAD